jgi:hypothetical protein
VLFLDVVDFGQMSKLSNVADETSHWTDRLGLSTDCLRNDVTFYVELSFNSDDDNERMRICTKNISATDFREKRTIPNPAIVTQQILVLPKSQKELFGFSDETKPNSNEGENDVLKSEDRPLAKIKKTRKNGKINFPVELVKLELLKIKKFKS